MFQEVLTAKVAATKEAFARKLKAMPPLSDERQRRALTEAQA